MKKRLDNVDRVCMPENHRGIVTDVTDVTDRELAETQ
jgi:hypothetical protein